MQLTEGETAQVLAAARHRFPVAQLPPLPVEVAEWLQKFARVFTSDPDRSSVVLLPGITDFGVLAAFVTYGPSAPAVPAEADWQALRDDVAGIPDDGGVRAVERLLVRGALLGWLPARGLLLELIRRVIRPALRWLYRKRIPDSEGRWEDEWVEQEATDSGGQILQWLIEGCECHRYAQELTTRDGAQTLCRTTHHFAHWQGDEPLARFLCRVAVCLYNYYGPAMNSFGGLEELCPAMLAVNEFRYGMLAKAALLGVLRAGYVLRCKATHGCTGEIDPTTDRCDQCGQLTESPEPKDFWLWVAGRYRPETCRPCRTDHYYYFLYDRPCARQVSDEPPHQWSKGNPRQVWVRVRNRGGGLVEHEPEPVGARPRWALTPAARQQFREAIDAIPADPVRDLAAELLSEESEPPRAASRRGTDILKVVFLEQWLEVLRVVPALLPRDLAELFGDEKVAALAKWLLEDCFTLKKAAKLHSHRVTSREFRLAVLEVLTRILGTILRQGSMHRDDEEDNADDAGGDPNPRLVEFVASMRPGEERAWAQELFVGRVPVDGIARQRGLNMETSEFVEQLLRTVRAMRAGLPFDPVARFADGELQPIAALLLGDEALDLAAIEQRMCRDHGYVRPREAVLGVLLNVIYAANGLNTGTTREEEEDA